MEENADPARYAAPVQSLDPRPHRSGEDDADEDEAEQQPQLPEDEHAHDDAYRDERDDERIAGLLAQIIAAHGRQPENTDEQRSYATDSSYPPA